jgi:DNA-directed RNA polymerase subunit RPC12/RpoP
MIKYICVRCEKLYKDGVIDTQRHNFVCEKCYNATKNK